MERDEVSPSVDQAQRLKQISAEGNWRTTSSTSSCGRKAAGAEGDAAERPAAKVFPASYTPKQMEEVIIKLLEGWHRRRQQEQAR